LIAALTTKTAAAKRNISKERNGNNRTCAQQNERNPHTHINTNGSTPTTPLQSMDLQDTQGYIHYTEYIYIDMD
jgi:hypothetical protein